MTPQKSQERERYTDALISFMEPESLISEVWPTAEYMHIDLLLQA